MKKLILVRTSFLPTKKLKLVSLHTLIMALSMTNLPHLWNKWLLSSLVQTVFDSDGLALRTRKLEQRKFSSWISDKRSRPKAWSHPHSLKLASHQFYKTFYIVLANSGGQFSGLRELFVMITIQNKIFFGMTCPYKVFFQKKKFFARNKSSHN